MTTLTLTWTLAAALLGQTARGVDLNAPPVPAAPLEARGVRYQISLLGPAGAPTPVSATTVFRSGQRFRLAVTPLERDAYIYVLTRGPEGYQAVLYPAGPAEHELVRKGDTVTLPSGDEFFRFTPPAGVERLRIIAAAEKLDWMNPAALWQLDGGNALSNQEIQLAENQQQARSKAIDLLVSEQATMPVYRRTLQEHRKELARTPATARSKNAVLAPPENTDSSQDLLVVSTDDTTRVSSGSSPPVVADVQLKHE